MNLRARPSIAVISTFFFLAQVLPCKASERIEKFVSKVPQNVHCIGITRDKHQTPSESLLESELYQWLLDCKTRLSNSVKGAGKLSGKKTAIFYVEISKEDNSAILSLKQSSGSKAVDQKSEDIIRAACPFKAPINDLPFRRGLLIEVGSSLVVVKLANKDFK